MRCQGPLQPPRCLHHSLTQLVAGCDQQPKIPSARETTPFGGFASYCCSSCTKVAWMGFGFAWRCTVLAKSPGSGVSRMAHPGVPRSCSASAGVSHSCTSPARSGLGFTRTVVSSMSEQIILPRQRSDSLVYTVLWSLAA